MKPNRKDAEVEYRRLLGVGNANEQVSPVATTIDHSRQRYPYCLLWSPIPLITWIFPFVGHTGIGDSNGVVFDFAGPYSIGRGHMAFGAPTKYLVLDPQLCVEKDWDTGVEEGCTIYSQRMHNLFLDNCHSHVARCLNEMSYDHKTNYGMFNIGVWLFFQGTFVSWGAVFQTFGPFVLLSVFMLWFLGCL